MQANTANSTLVDLLRAKDETADYPEEWDKVRGNKNQYFLKFEEQARFEHIAAAKCIQPCFNNTKTSVVNVEESNCMTSCVSKALETRALFDYLQTKDSYKKSKK